MQPYSSLRIFHRVLQIQHDQIRLIYVRVLDQPRFLRV